MLTQKLEREKPPFVLVFGGPGTGKTAYLTANAVTAMTDRKIARRDIRNSSNIIEKLNEGGWKFSFPQQHLVFADYRIETHRCVSYEIDVKNFGLPSETKTEAQIFPPFSRLFLDESQRKFNSRAGGIDADLSLFAEIRRHNDLAVMLACQRERLIDLNVRELVDKIVEIKDMKHTYDRNKRLVKTTWTCYEFDNCFAVDSYLDSGKNLKHGKKVHYIFNGNIFKCYDHQHSRPAFYNGCYNRDFNFKAAVKSDFTVASMKEYNDKHFN